MVHCVYATVANLLMYHYCHCHDSRILMHTRKVASSATSFGINTTLPSNNGLPIFEKSIDYYMSAKIKRITATLQQLKWKFEF